MLAGVSRHFFEVHCLHQFHEGLCVHVFRSNVCFVLGTCHLVDLDVRRLTWCCVSVGRSGYQIDEQGCQKALAEAAGRPHLSARCNRARSSLNTLFLFEPTCTTVKRTGSVETRGTTTLWLHGTVKCERIQLERMESRFNPADMGTNVLSGDRIRTLISILKITYICHGRALKD